LEDVSRGRRIGEDDDVFKDFIDVSSIKELL